VDELSDSNFILYTMQPSMFFSAKVTADT